jgi:hypothetical protein
MPWGRWLSCCLAAGVTMFFVGAAFHLLVPLLAPTVAPQYRDQAVFRPWSCWTPTYMALHPLGYGFVFASVYLVLRRGSAIPAAMRGGLLYGSGVFVVGSLPVYLLTYAALQISSAVIALWIVQSFAQYFVAGLVVGWMAGGGMGASRSGQC